MILRVTKVDMDGYLGRDNHPHPSDEGLLVSVIGLESYVMDGEGRSVEQAIHDKDWRAGKASDAAKSAAADEIAGRDGGLVFERCWMCLTEDGRTLELMDHEVELFQSGR